MSLPTDRYTQQQRRHAAATLRRARRLISRQSRWIKGQFFGRLDGMPAWGTEDAQTFCALGAIQKANGPGEEEAKRFLAVAASELGGYKRLSTDITRVWKFNDRKKTAHEDILAAFDKALEIAQAEAEAGK